MHLAYARALLYTNDMLFQTYTYHCYMLLMHIRFILSPDYRRAHVQSGIFITIRKLIGFYDLADGKKNYNNHVYLRIL